MKKTMSILVLTIVSVISTDGFAGEKADPVASVCAAIRADVKAVGTVALETCVNSLQAALLAEYRILELQAKIEALKADDSTATLAEIGDAINELENAISKALEDKRATEGTLLSGILDARYAETAAKENLTQAEALQVAAGKSKADAESAKAAAEKARGLYTGTDESQIASLDAAVRVAADKVNMTAARLVKADEDLAAANALIPTVGKARDAAEVAYIEYLLSK